MTGENRIMRLKETAYQMRRKLLLLCGDYEGAVHIGGDLSMTDVLVALFHYGMNVNPEDVKMPDRDRFILSKGHGAVGMYIAMALRGFFDYDEIVRTYGKLDSAFGMHPCRTQLPALECSSGSLGQGLAMAVGMALSAKQQSQRHRVFCMLGDGETCEGEVWEAALCANSFKLGNLVAVVDRNFQLMTSRSEEAVVLEPYPEKWEAFGWNVRVIDGHDMRAIVDAIDALPAVGSDRPTVLICNTTKGKGVSFMEKNIDWHMGSLTQEEMNVALADVDAAWAQEGGGL